MRWLATLCGVRFERKPVGVFPDPNSETAEAYVTSNAAAKPKDSLFAVTVTSIEDDSPNTKLITLVVVNDKSKFAFRPGQWVDFHAPGVLKPGGYSIASSPGRFVKDATFQLAIRESRSSHCAHWVHEKCKKGDEAKVRVGGKFSASALDLEHPLVLVAGGIGIAPILGMLQTFLEEQLGSNPGDTTKQKVRVVLLCSTKNPQTQPMLPEILSAVRNANGAVKCVFHRTDGGASSEENKNTEHDNQACEENKFKGKEYASCDEHKNKDKNKNKNKNKTRDATENVSVKKGRIERESLRDALIALRSSGGKKQPIAFLCGPPALSDATETSLLTLGVPKEDLRLERWW